MALDSSHVSEVDEFFDENYDEIDYEIMLLDDDSLKDKTQVEEVHLAVESDSHEMMLEDVDFDQNILEEVENAGGATNEEVQLENVPEISHEANTSSNNKDDLFCPLCKKKYVRKHAYKKHVEKCEKDPSQGPAKSKKKKDDRTGLQTSEKDILKESKRLVVDVLTEIVNDPINNIVIENIQTPGNLRRALCQDLLRLQETPQFILSCSKHCKAILEISSKFKLHKDTGLEKFWSELTSLNGKLFWVHVVSANSAEFFSVAHILSIEIAKGILKLENSTLTEKAESDTTDIPFSKSEQEIVAYVGGFIINCFKKRFYRLVKSPRLSTREAAGCSLRFFSSIQLRGAEKHSTNSFLEFTRKWTLTQDRGGLIYLKDVSFIFFRRIEMVVRRVLNVKFLRDYKSQDLRDLLLTRLMKNYLVLKGWEELSKTLNNESLKKILFKQILEKWIDLRLRSYVRAFVQVLKRRFSREKSKKTDGEKLEKPASQIAEPGLRKSLYT
ncbi:uncharacterized protein [Clytia hemisphaerica]|uniref:uncharacterized protein n=1 Tax=Clytia hemisphaerica TaxID=252671 RepID=UPI0034D61009